MLCDIYTSKQPLPVVVYHSMLCNIYISICLLCTHSLSVIQFSVTFILLSIYCALFCCYNSVLCDNYTCKRPFLAFSLSIMKWHVTFILLNVYCSPFCCPSFNPLWHLYSKRLLRTFLLSIVVCSHQRCTEIRKCIAFSSKWRNGSKYEHCRIPRTRGKSEFLRILLFYENY